LTFFFHISKFGEQILNLTKRKKMIESRVVKLLTKIYNDISKIMPQSVSKKSNAASLLYMGLQINVYYIEIHLKDIATH
jgi:uncharacterized membrane protein required for colicin V production